jgi:hypothetical protein
MDPDPAKDASKHHLKLVVQLCWRSLQKLLSMVG